MWLAARAAPRPGSTLQPRSALPLTVSSGASLRSETTTVVANARPRGSGDPPPPLRYSATRSRDQARTPPPPFDLIDRSLSRRGWPLSPYPLFLPSTSPPHPPTPLPLLTFTDHDLVTTRRTKSPYRPTQGEGTPSHNCNPYPAQLPRSPSPRSRQAHSGPPLFGLVGLDQGGFGLFVGALVVE